MNNYSKDKNEFLECGMQKRKCGIAYIKNFISFLLFVEVDLV